MKYLIPKQIKPDDFEIFESKTIYKIKNTNNHIILFGIPLELKNATIVKDYNKYYIILSDNDFQTIQIYNSFLAKAIERLKNITSIYKNKNVLIIYPNYVIKEYYSKKLTTFHINIKYVKKSGLLNFPVINIL